jgi:hypothetical protein
LHFLSLIVLQRQIEVGTIIQLYQLELELVTNEWHEKTSQTLCKMLIALRSLLTDRRTREEIQQVMVDNNVLDTVITVIEESTVSARIFASLSLHENCTRYVSGTLGYQCMEFITLEYRS